MITETRGDLMRRRRSPQEKKQLSLERDRRNTYGENDKASRKGIPFRKRLVNKTNRTRDRQLLRGAAGSVGPMEAEEVESRMLGRRRKRWQKYSDTPLGEFLARKRKKAGGPDHSEH